MLDSREPPHGDFVAFVEKIEREQLARTLQPHRLPHLTAGGAVAGHDGADGRSSARPAAEAQRAPTATKGRREGSAAPVGAMIGALIGALLIAFGLLAEGGIVLVLVGAVLLWHSLRKLRRRARPTQVSPGQQVDHAFGQKAPSSTRRR